MSSRLADYIAAHEGTGRAMSGSNDAAGTTSACHQALWL
jgi:hypothetical protein